jgi:hypothetical protein
MADGVPDAPIRRQAADVQFGTNRGGSTSLDVTWVADLPFDVANPCPRTIAPANGMPQSPVRCHREHVNLVLYLRGCNVNNRSWITSLPFDVSESRPGTRSVTDGMNPCARRGASHNMKVSALERT